MNTGHRSAAALLTAWLGLAVVACSPAVSPAAPRTSAPATGTPSSTSQAPAEVTGTNQEDHVRITITIGDERFQATLQDSAASRDLVAQLPLTLQMNDHGSVEKTGALPERLSLDGQPPGADPDVGDVGYYAPGNDFVLYYGDQTYYPGIVILGRLDGDAAQRLEARHGSITATLDS